MGRLQDHTCLPCYHTTWQAIFYLRYAHAFSIILTPFLLVILFVFSHTWICGSQPRLPTYDCHPLQAANCCRFNASWWLKGLNTHLILNNSDLVGEENILKTTIVRPSVERVMSTLMIHWQVKKELKGLIILGLGLLCSKSYDNWSDHWW